MPIFLLAASHTLITINVSDLDSSHDNNADDITVQAMVARYAANDGKQVKRSYDVALLLNGNFLDALTKRNGIPGNYYQGYNQQGGRHHGSDKFNGMTREGM